MNHGVRQGTIQKIKKLAMKTFKKDIIWSSAVAFIIFISILISCQKNSSKAKEEIILIYSSIGEIHNSGLDYVYNDLQKQYLNLVNGNYSKINHDKIFKVIDNSVMKFVNKSLTTENIDLSLVIEKNNTNNPIKEYLNKDLVSQIKSLKEAENLSNEFFVLMTQLNLLVDKDASKIEFDNLMKTGILKLNDFDEKAKFVSCVSIGYSSLQYWKINATRWLQLLSNGNSQLLTKVPSSIIDINVISSVPKETITSIGKSDITGIITGGVGGCIYGAGGGTTILPGVGTLTGCAAVGSAGAITVGLGNSAKAAVESFVNWLTS